MAIEPEMEVEKFSNFFSKITIEEARRSAVGPEHCSWQGIETATR